MLLSVAKDANLNNRSKTTHYAQNYPAHYAHTVSSQLFYSLPFVLFFQNSPNKVSRLLFILVRVSTGHAHFSNDEIHISWVPMRHSTVFFSCRAPENLTRKAGFEVC